VSPEARTTSYYADKLGSLTDLFGRPASLGPRGLEVGGRTYPIVEDVILLGEEPGGAAEDIRFTFGEEWRSYGTILPEHEEEFERYFDLVDLDALKGSRVCDLGCGMGRWSHFLKDRVRELVLVDFSEAVFVARRNLAGARNALFFKGDLTRLPFREDFADFLFCLGVLHHLPTPCLDEVRKLRRGAPEVLVFLYYALDNRPAYFRWLLAAVTVLRRVLCRVKDPFVRKAFSAAGAWGIYLPLVLLGRALRPLGLASRVPLYDFYHDKSMRRIEADVYDRFFTRIEQRVTRQEVLGLRDAFSEVKVSQSLPYWHFLLRR